MTGVKPVDPPSTLSRALNPSWINQLHVFSGGSPSLANSQTSEEGWIHVTEV